MILSIHSMLGAGVATRRKRPRDDTTQQVMNYKGSSRSTRYLLAVLPKAMYDHGKDEVFHSLIDLLAEDLASLASKGVTGHDGLQYYGVTVHCKGDWPFLVKCGQLTRSFYNMPKRQSSRKDPTGCCHYCLGGRPEFPFEDLVGACEWQYSIGYEKPWLEVPPIFKCPHDPSFPEGFLATDPWHNFHLGEGRNLVCNLVKLILPLTPGSNEDTRLSNLFGDYALYCQQHRRQAFITKFTPNFLGLSASDFPAGGWTKGNLTTSLIKWLVHYMKQRQNTFESGSLLEKAEPWTWQINWRFCLNKRPSSGRCVIIVSWGMFVAIFVSFFLCNIKI